ncbi:MAG: hypothetical protein ABIN44_09435 [Burkholderiaceae bacterium]
MSESPEAFIRAELAGFTWKRRAPRPEDDKLLVHTRNWLSALPKGVRPIHMPARFPRIVNDLSRLWWEPAALSQFFEEKEFSPRTNRRGFPPLIKEELLCMHLFSLRNRSRQYERRTPRQESLLDGRGVVRASP